MSGASRSRCFSCDFVFRTPASAALLLAALGVPALVQAQSAHDADAGTYSLVYSFQCGSDGGDPSGGLVRDSAGNFYGTTQDAGAFGLGTVFRLTPSGTETVLHSFAGGPADGQSPAFASLILDRAGNLYGTTSTGGMLGAGVVFKVTSAGAESVLYNFTGGADGNYPLGDLARDNGGNLYGGTNQGGAFGAGTVFKVTSGGAETVLYSFGSTSTDAANPVGGLALAPSGDLYGTTAKGGAFGQGTVFRVSSSGVETVLHSFAGAPGDGAAPDGTSVLRDSAGNLYAVTYSGGAENQGTVFEVSASGTETVLLNFGGGSSGQNPLDGLARSPHGDLYGTTHFGGSSQCGGSQGCGVLFEVTTTGTEEVLHSFAGGSTDGQNPPGGVTLDPMGALWGTVFSGGGFGCGAVFRFTR